MQADIAGFICMEMAFRRTHLGCKIKYSFIALSRPKERQRQKLSLEARQVVVPQLEVGNTLVCPTTVSEHYDSAILPSIFSTHFGAPKAIVFHPFWCLQNSSHAPTNGSRTWPHVAQTLGDLRRKCIVGA